MDVDNQFNTNEVQQLVKVNFSIVVILRQRNCALL